MCCVGHRNAGSTFHAVQDIRSAVSEDDNGVLLRKTTLRCSWRGMNMGPYVMSAVTELYLCHLNSNQPSVPLRNSRRAGVKPAARFPWKLVEVLLII